MSSQTILMIEPNDVIALTALDGNIDVDNIKPLIFIAQTTYLQSFLGIKLYDKIYSDFINDSLSGNYLTIFNKFVKDLLSYKTSSLYVEFGGYKVSENGIHKIVTANRETLQESETDALALRYNKLVANVETNFKEFTKDLGISELDGVEVTINNDFPWH
jgi:hypothetical protein